MQYCTQYKDAQNILGTIVQNVNRQIYCTQYIISLQVKTTANTNIKGVIT